MINSFVRKFFSPAEVPCTALVLYEDSESEVSLQAQIDRLKHDIKYVRDVMETEQAFRDEMFSEINPALYELIAKLDMLKGKHEAYLYEAKAQASQGTFNPEDLEDNDLGEGSDKDFIEGNREVEPDKVNRDTRKACARLFKKISNLTHPDKNGGSTILTDTFHAAYGAYKSNDLETLEAIWDNLKGSKSKIKSVANKSKERLKLLLAEYKKVYASVEQEWKAFMETEDAILASIYRKSGISAVTAAYRRMLNISIEEYESAIDNIRYASGDSVRFDDLDKSQINVDEEDEDDWDWEGDFEPNIDNTRPIYEFEDGDDDLE